MIVAKYAMLILLAIVASWLAYCFAKGFVIGFKQGLQRPLLSILNPKTLWCDCGEEDTEDG